MSVTDAQVFDAIDAYKEELKSWDVAPDESSRWNDRGTIRHHYFIVSDRRRRMGWDYPLEAVPVTATFTMLRLPADIAGDYPKFQAMKKALETIS